MKRTILRILVAATAAVAAGCGATGATDVIVDWCASPPTSKDAALVASIIASASGRHHLDGTWLNGRTGTVATIDVTVGEKLADSTTGCGGTMLVEATAIVKTRDGLVDVQGTVLKFEAPYEAHLDIPLPDLAEAFAHPDAGLGSFPHDGVRPTRSAAPTMVLSFTAGGRRADVIVEGERSVGMWSSMVQEIPRRAAPRYSVPPELVDACAPEAVYVGGHDQYMPFASAAEALAAMPGTWIRCRGYGGQAHAGIQISPDGTWRYLTWQGGAFFTSPGLLREGTLGTPIDTYSQGFNFPGFYQVDLLGPRVWHGAHRWADLLILGDDTAPAELAESVYVRSDRAVTETPIPYAAGERAGRDACAVPETGTIDPNVGSELEGTLAGEWTVCTGESLEGYTRLRFDGQNGVKFLDEGGNELADRTFKEIHGETVPPSSPRVTALVFGEEESWAIMFSQRPLKLWTQIEAQHAVGRELLLSPTP